jgi:hypothetical protein
MTNLINLHTSTTRRVDLIIAGVLVPHRELFEFAGDVVYHPRVGVLVGVHPIGHGGSRAALVLLDIVEGSVEELVARVENGQFISRSVLTIFLHYDFVPVFTEL